MVQANDAESFMGWLYEGLQELGEPVLRWLVLNVMLPCSLRQRRTGSSLGISDSVSETSRGKSQQKSDRLARRIVMLYVSSIALLCLWERHQ